MDIYKIIFKFMLTALVFIYTFSCASKENKNSKSVNNYKTQNLQTVKKDNTTDNYKRLKKANIYHIPPPPPPENFVEDINKSPYHILEKETITLIANNSPLREVLFTIANDLGLNLIISPEVDENISITVNFQSTPVKQAMDLISDLANIYYDIKGGIIYIKAFETKIFHLPYLTTLSKYSVNLGGDVLGSATLSAFSGGGAGGGGGTAGGGGGAGGGAGGLGLQGNFSLEFARDEAESDFFSILSSNIRNLLSSDGQLTINRMTGTIIIKDRRKNLKLVEKFINKIKKEISKQILIEAKIVEVSLSKGWEYGINWSALLNSVKGVGITLNQTLALNNSFGSISVSSLDFDVLLNALKAVGEIDTLSNPRIRVLNGQSALISTGTIIPYWERSLEQNVANTAGTTQTVTYTRSSVLDGILLGVMPVINPDGTITMNIIPVSSTIKGDKQLTVNNQVISEAPIIDIKEAGTLVKVKDGDTIIIGGFISKNKKHLKSKIPLLGDIPIFGKLFTRENYLFEKKELIIFLKPKIIREID